MEGTTAAGARLDAGFVEDWSRRYLEAWNSLDADGVAAMCTEDVVWKDPGLPEPAHGRDGVRAFVRATAHGFPDFHVEELGRPYASVEEPRVLSRYRMTGTMLGSWDYTDLAATGHRIDVLGIDQWTFSGELMSRYQTYYDSLDMAPPTWHPAAGGEPARPRHGGDSAPAGAISATQVPKRGLGALKADSVAPWGIAVLPRLRRNRCRHRDLRPAPRASLSGSL